MASKASMSPALSQAAPTYDVLRLPGVGQLLRWRWGRLVLQLPLLALASVMIYDGLTGPQLAPQNVATVAAWVHYRGLVVLALLLVGNLFCMSCPFALPRTVARRLSGQGRRWPRALRNKWLAIAALVALFWAYEAFDLWASPWLTAWVAIGYFAAAFVLETVFAESPFCKYLCPLGTFNFVGSTVSPLQVTARSQDVCRTCAGKECVNGTAGMSMLGCGTELFVPQVHSNMDCVLCLDCARACPHDNVALAVRKPLQELTSSQWPARWDLALLVLVFAFAGVSNAFGMVPPVYALEAWLGQALGIRSEGLVLLVIFGVLNLALPLALGLVAAWLSLHLSGVERRGRQLSGRDGIRVVLARYAPAVVPLGFAIWFAHYSFHFATGALTAVPVVQSFLLDHGLAMLGKEPAWALGPIVPAEWLFPLEAITVAIGFLASAFVLYRTAFTAHASDRAARQAALPWLALLTLLALAAIVIFMLPMEMRGSAGFTG